MNREWSETRWKMIRFCELGIVPSVNTITASLMKWTFPCLNKYWVRTNKISAGFLKLTTLTFRSWLSLSRARACAECVLSSSGMGDILPDCHYLHSFMILGWPISVGTGYTKRERNESVFHGVSSFFLFCSFHLTFFSHPVYIGRQGGVYVP